MSQENCQLRFRIRYKLDQKKQFLVILGNDPKFGNWRESQALISRCLRKDEWEVSVNCRNGSLVEWKWVVMEEGMKVVRWEDGNNRKTEVKHNGVMYCVWDRKDVGEVVEAQEDHLQLSTEYRTESGQSLRLVGSTPELGAWEPGRGVQGEQTRPGSGVWVVHVRVDRFQPVEFKWVVVDSGLEAVRWEERDNRILLPTDDRRKLVALRNQDCVVDEGEDEERAAESELTVDETEDESHSKTVPVTSNQQSTTGYIRRAAGTVFNVIALPFRLTTGTIMLIGQSLSRHFTYTQRGGGVP